jgi:crossover junction endodeoxyribonuclease RuvC
MIIIGIDPGKNGGLAVIERLSKESFDVVDVLQMPIGGDEIDFEAVANWVWEHDARSESCVGIMEKVGAMPGNGVTGMFKFGKSVGGIIGVFAALMVPLRQVTPMAWKKIVLAGMDWKNNGKGVAIDYVRMAYPEVCIIPKGCRKPHSGIVDAICIAEYYAKTL